MNDARLELRVKNNRLFEAIHQTHPSMRKFCQTAKLNYSKVVALVTLKDSPYRVCNGELLGDYRDFARQLAESLGMDPDDLYPRALYEKFLGESLIVRTVRSTEIVAPESLDILPAPDTREDRFPITAEEVEPFLGQLPYRQREVIKLRFGIGYGEAYTLQQVAKIFRVTMERVRQIELEAIRALEHLMKAALAKSKGGDNGNP